MQLPIPTTDLYVPASHAAHATPSDSAVCPAMQLQSPTAVLAKDELVPEGHAEQAADPYTPLYVPRAQGEHTPPFAPEYPGRHTQSDRRLLRLADHA